MNKPQNTFLIEKGASVAQIRRDLHLGGRVSISDLDLGGQVSTLGPGGSALDRGGWLSPVVVLRRLTVTVGGFRIELLPGPSYAEAAGAQTICLEDGVSYGGEVEYAVVPEPSASAETPAGLSAVQAGSRQDEVPLGLGPYVNPNEDRKSTR